SAWLTVAVVGTGADRAWPSGTLSRSVVRGNRSVHVGPTAVRGPRAGRRCRRVAGRPPGVTWVSRPAWTPPAAPTSAPVREDGRQMVYRYFYDCEFIEDGRVIDLVSIGVVDEQGREFYAVSTEFDAAKALPWVRRNVLDKLPSPGDPAWRSRERIRDDL